MSTAGAPTGKAVGSFDRDGNPDWSMGIIAACFGKKRSGKSVMGLVLFDAYPYDRVVISANPGDGPQPDPERDIFQIHGTVDTLPAAWPEELRRDGRRMTLVYRPDVGSPTALEDVDHVLGMVRRHGNCLLLVHEVALIAPSGKVPPNMRRLLVTNRHDGVSMILCGPRPITVDPLVLGQADLVYIFELQVQDDRDRIAGAVGWDKRDLYAELDELGPHEYLLFDANADKPGPGEPDLRLIHCQALPRDVVERATRASG